MEENINFNSPNKIGLDDIAKVFECSELLLKFLLNTELISLEEMSEILEIKKRDGNSSSLRKIFELLYGQENLVEKKQVGGKLEGAGALDVLKALYEMSNLDLSPFPAYIELTAVKEAVKSGVGLGQKDKNGLTQLHRMFSQGNNLDIDKAREIVKYLAGMNLIELFNIKGGNGQLTPLQLLLTHVEVDNNTIEILWRNGADFDVKEITGHSILECVIWNFKNTRLLPTLIIYGADLNTIDENGNNLVHVAATAGNLEALEVLMREKGVGLYTLNRTMSTPLHRAVCFATTNILPIVKFLVEKGALLDKDLSGRTVLQMAEKRVNDKLVGSEMKLVVQYLKDYLENSLDVEKAT